MRWSIRHHNLSPHHLYQLEIVLLFAVGFFLFLPYYYLVDEVYALDMNTWQWYFMIPWLLFYSAYTLVQRSKTKPEERLAPAKRHIVHWVLFGLSLVMLHLQPTDLEQLAAIDVSFIVFSLFLVDSYWDFRKGV